MATSLRRIAVVGLIILGTFTICDAKKVNSPDPMFKKTWQNPDKLQDLELFNLKPVSMHCDAGVEQKGRDGVVATSDGDVRFDFGQVNAGWLVFRCDALPEGTKCSISEFNEPAVFNAGSQSPAKTKEPVRLEDGSYRLELNSELYEGVRYAWIHFRGVAEPVKVTDIHLVCQAKPVNYLGSFDSDNEMLDKIWYAAAYTVRLNLMKDYFGAILMERSDRFSWTGDAHTSQAASMVAFGNYPFVRKNIINTSNQDNGILSYSILWIQSVVDYVMYSGDMAIADSLSTNIQGKFHKAIHHLKVGSNPSFYGWDERLGAGFENPGCDETRSAYRMLTIQTLNRYASILPDGDAFADQCHFWADSLSASVREDAQWMDKMALFSASDAVNAGFVEASEYPALWSKVYDDRLQRVSYSPFNEYFVLNAMARMGRYDEAMNTIDDCWGGQVRYGGTTFFEVFRPSWNDCKLDQNDAPVNNQCGYTSLTHPWSAGVAKWLSEEVLGVKPTAPGFDACVIEPHLCGGLTRVKGTVPTPKGIISVSINSRRGVCKVAMPDGIEASLVLPDGKEVALKAGRNRARFAAQAPSVASDDEFRYTYPAEAFAEDTTSHGDWVGKYGSKGYMLMSFDGPGQHRTNLPEGVLSFRAEGNGSGYNGAYADAAADPRALESDRGDGVRAMGAWYTQDPIACRQTITVDVDIRQEAPYSLTMYFIDWEGVGRRSAIEVFDLDSKKLVAPVHMVRDQKGGKYVTITLNQPVRIRVDQVRGTNACIGAFFID